MIMQIFSLIILSYHGCLHDTTFRPRDRHLFFIQDIIDIIDITTIIYQINKTNL